MEIVGQRTEGADEAVADALGAAESFVASGRNKQKTSIYTGVSEHKGWGHQWQSQISVGPKHGEILTPSDIHDTVRVLLAD